MPAVIKVVHTKKEPTSYYVGRPSPLGNPFVWDRSTPRGSTIPAYRNWFLQQLYSDNRAFHREFAARIPLPLNALAFREGRNCRDLLSMNIFILSLKTLYNKFSERW